MTPEKGFHTNGTAVTQQLSFRLIVCDLHVFPGPLFG